MRVVKGHYVSTTFFALQHPVCIKLDARRRTPSRPRSAGNPQRPLLSANQRPAAFLRRFLAG